MFIKVFLYFIKTDCDPVLCFYMQALLMHLFDIVLVIFLKDLDTSCVRHWMWVIHCDYHASLIVKPVLCMITGCVDNRKSAVHYNKKINLS